MTMTHKMLAVLGLVAVLLVGQFLFAAGAAQGALPSRLPIRHHDSVDRSGPVGAYLALTVTSDMAPYAWHAVQWQDSAGGWHDVEGWRSQSGDGSVWWVDAKDFGTGPFRWVTKDGVDGQVIEASMPFQLPSVANETLWVSVAPQS
jgi:hypothetical protein